MEPLVSIITPSFNSSKYLDAYFQSIKNQDYSNYEIIFINDGSTDETEDIVLKYKKYFENQGKRFMYLKQENGGQAKAMNYGFPYIQGKYFIWPDSDDELYSNNISEKVKFMESNPDISLGISGADYVDEKGNILDHLERKCMSDDDFFKDLLISNNVVFCPGIYIMRTDAFFKWIPNGQINESRIGQNYQILLPIAYHEKWGYIHKTLYKYILHENSHSNKNNDKYEYEIIRFQKQEKTLYELLESICDKDDLQYYSNLVYSHFHKFYLRLANQYGKKDDLKKYYKEISCVNENGFKEKIYYIMGLLGIRKR